MHPHDRDQPHDGHCSAPAPSYLRRDFLSRAAALGALGLLGLTPAPARARPRAAQERFPVVASEPWGRILQLGDGVWALESTPLDDRTTLCNGGIVAGRAGVVLVESFASADGARWMVEQARRLTGRAPSHLVLSHFHGDHVNGLAGVEGVRGLEVLATSATLARVPGGPDSATPLDLDFRTVGEGRPTELDLGNRSVLLVPRSGHTPSDLTAEVFDASVVFCGDLIWNGMFPNYVDAIPGRLSQTARVLRARGAGVYVTGHGRIADADALDVYLALLDDVERAAREALARGWTAEEAGARYRLPEPVADWTLFNAGYFARAIDAWMRALAERHDNFVPLVD